MPIDTQQRFVVQWGRLPELSRAELRRRFPAVREGRRLSGGFSVLTGACDMAALPRTLGGVRAVFGPLSGLPTDADALPARICALGGATAGQLRQRLPRSGARIVPPTSRPLAVATALHGQLEIAPLLAVSVPSDFSVLEFEKPVRDARVGMLPQKLARMMLSLCFSAGRPPRAIWDPCCGTGTLLLEAARADILAFGSDADEKMVRAALQNMQHFFANSGAQIWQADMCDADAAATQALPVGAAVLTEGYLGPMFSKLATESEIARAKAAVLPVANGILKNAKAAGAARVVMCLPVWKTRAGKREYVPLPQGKSDWRVLPENPASPRGTVYSERPGAFVGREIIVLEPQG